MTRRYRARTLWHSSGKRAKLVRKIVKKKAPAVENNSTAPSNSNSDGHDIYKEAKQSVDQHDGLALKGSRTEPERKREVH